MTRPALWSKGNSVILQHPLTDSQRDLAPDKLETIKALFPLHLSLSLISNSTAKRRDGQERLGNQMGISLYMLLSSDLDTTRAIFSYLLLLS